MLSEQAPSAKNSSFSYLYPSEFTISLTEHNTTLRKQQTITTPMKISLVLCLVGGGVRDNSSSCLRPLSMLYPSV